VTAPHELADLRLAFLCKAYDQRGKPYLWGAKGPDAFDCSGLVTWLLHELGVCDWRAEHNAQRLYNELSKTEAPRPGDLVFYGAGPTHITHVMIHFGTGQVLGACGGNSDTTSIEIARARGARVRFRGSPNYRPDLVGYAVSPLDPKGSTP
jgi:murein DD-endopeptidase